MSNLFQSCDKISDIEAGRKTLSIVLSERANAIVIAGEFYGAYSIGILLGFTSLLPIHVSLSLLIALFIGQIEYRKMIKDGFSLLTKGISMGHVSKLFLIYVLFFNLGIIAFIITSTNIPS